ncbi:MAG: hypothetical protein ACT4NL_05170 [Pseudomarimonas sp.]
MSTPMALHLTASLLRQGRSLNALSLLATALAASWLLLMATGLSSVATATLALVLLSLLFGVVQTYHALRVDLDARLLHELARAAQASGDDLAAATAELDHALRSQGLVKPEKPAADWPRRLAGAREWWHRQMLALLLQVAALAAALLLALRSTLLLGPG